MAESLLQKSWYTVVAPDIFEGKEVAETPAETDSQVLSRTVREPLNDLMEGAEKYYMSVALGVTEVEGNKAFTRIKGVECSGEFVSRLVRPGSDRLDAVVDVETEEGLEVRVKIVGATTSNTSSHRLTDLRNTASRRIREFASESTYEELMEAIFLDELQGQLREELESIYPLRELEIRKTELME